MVVDPGQREDNFDQLDERSDWFYEAIGSSYAMVTTTAGVGSTSQGLDRRPEESSPSAALDRLPRR